MQSLFSGHFSPQTPSILNSRHCPRIYKHIIIPYHRVHHFPEARKLFGELQSVLFGDWISTHSTLTSLSLSTRDPNEKPADIDSGATEERVARSFLFSETACDPLSDLSSPEALISSCSFGAEQTVVLSIRRSRLPGQKQNCSLGLSLVYFSGSLGLFEWVVARMPFYHSIIWKREIFV